MTDLFQHFQLKHDEPPRLIGLLDAVANFYFMAVVVVVAAAAAAAACK